jgi:hypothetical protein
MWPCRVLRRTLPRFLQKPWQSPSQNTGNPPHWLTSSSAHVQSTSTAPACSQKRGMPSFSAAAAVTMPRKGWLPTHTTTQAAAADTITAADNATVARDAESALILQHMIPPLQHAIPPLQHMIITPLQHVITPHLMPAGIRRARPNHPTAGAQTSEPKCGCAVAKSTESRRRRGHGVRYRQPSQPHCCLRLFGSS